MKELTIEQKAKAYDEAYKKVAIRFGSNVADEIFPELAESDDERIRKELIEFVKSRLAGFPQCERFIAWLEKMGEHLKFCKTIQIGDKVTKNEDGVLVNMSQLDRIAKPRKKKSESWLEKQGEINPYSGTSFEYNGHTWGMCARDNGVEILFDSELKAFLSSEKSFIYPIHPQPELAPKSALEAIKEEKVDNRNYINSIDKIEPKFNVEDKVYNIKDGFECTIESIDDTTYYCDTTNFDIKDQDNWKLVEQKPAWSEEDTDMFGSILATLSMCMNNTQIPTDNRKIIKKEYEWFNKLYDRCLPKQEWSEEDEKNYDISLKILCASNKSEKLINNLYDWFKSLKDRVQPHNTWKPSKEQMGVIEAVINNRSFQRRYLDSLYQDLLKLREE